MLNPFVESLRSWKPIMCYFMLPDVVYNTQRNTITSLLSLWYVYHLGRLEALPLPSELDSLRLRVEWIPTTLRGAKKKCSRSHVSSKLTPGCLTVQASWKHGAQCTIQPTGSWAFWCRCVSFLDFFNCSETHEGSFVSLCFF